MPPLRQVRCENQSKKCRLFQVRNPDPGKSETHSLLPPEQIFLYSSVSNTTSSSGAVGASSPPWGSCRRPALFVTFSQSPYLQCEAEEILLISDWKEVWLLFSNRLIQLVDVCLEEMYFCVLCNGTVVPWMFLSFKMIFMWGARGCRHFLPSQDAPFLLVN